MRDPRPVRMIDCPSTGEQRPVDDCKQFGIQAPIYNPIAVQQWRDCQSCEHCRGADGDLIRPNNDGNEWSGAVSRERWEALKTRLILAYRDGLNPERIMRDIPQIDSRWIGLFAGNDQLVRMNRQRDYPDEPTHFELNVGRLETYLKEFITGKARGSSEIVVTAVTRAFIVAAELARATGRIVLYDAASGLGKTKGADYYLAQTRMAEGIGCPVWKIKLDPNGLSPLYVLRQIANETIGIDGNDKRKAPELANAIHAKTAGGMGLNRPGY